MHAKAQDAIRTRPVVGLVGCAWAGPSTALGLLLGMLARRRPQQCRRVLEYDVRRTWLDGMCARLGVSAFTVGNCVFYTCPVTDSLRTHENRHVKQYALLGPLFLPIYFILMLAFGYKDHPLERDARSAELREHGRLFPSKLR